MQLILHPDELLHLALHEARDRNPGPLRHDLGNVLLVDLFLQHGVSALKLVEATGPNFDLRVEIAHRAVAKLSRTLEITVSFRLLGVGTRGLERLFAPPDLGDPVLLQLPLRGHRIAFLGESGQFGLEGGEALLRRVVGLLRERGLLDLQLTDAPFHDVEFIRHRVDLDPQP